ncbi:DUF2953 family protein [Anaerobacterium chartisolvens]|uniref:DUF2953 family protein n=1 Tax=Anaerobacterium chartisolvens TaxID=1297424 RepID=A0A369B474_9FIRM|nr:DUF2953 domain-containing protein [Anaerobacterium chartisolvens]RCX16360.1 DUF2953 family protein [Anaerobacterium chartisolvens]
MLYLAMFFLLLAAVPAFLLSIKVRAVIELVIDKNESKLEFYFFVLGGILKYRRSVPLGSDRDTDGKFDIKEAETRAGEYRQWYGRNKFIIYRLKKYLSKRVRIEELSVEAGFGTGDAFYTGILSGLLWGLGGVLTAYISNSFIVLKKRFNIMSYFDRSGFDVDSRCILTGRIVHIIVVRLIILIDKRKRKRK